MPKSPAAPTVVSLDIMGVSEGETESPAAVQQHNSLFSYAVAALGGCVCERESTLFLDTLAATMRGLKEPQKSPKIPKRAPRCAKCRRFPPPPYSRT